MASVAPSSLSNPESANPESANLRSGRPWLDTALPVDARVELLLAEMTIEEKVGQMFHSMLTIGPDGALADGDPAFGIPSTDALVGDRHMTHFNLVGGGEFTAGQIARWHNALQERAAATRLGIPVTLSSDPRHAFAENPGTAARSGAFSQWPEPMGLAATRDAALVERFGDIARREYLAVGLRLALHPQIDLATEPRWARAVQTFGEDAELTGELAAAYIRGFQGEQLGSHSVATMTKHFPGGGAQKDGEDPHFPYGREQVYPGGAFEEHLKPFAAAFAAGTSQIMPYYGMPVGTEYEEVGFGFNRSVITGLLRERFGFDGVVCTDWGLISDAEILGDLHVARAWGVEHLDRAGRVQKVLEAGADQFGGEVCTDVLLALVHSGAVPVARVDASVRRLLRDKFVLGLFDDMRFVEVEAADAVAGRAEFRDEGERAQRASIVLLSHDSSHGILPLPVRPRIYAEGITPEQLAPYGTPAADPAEADVAILRLRAPFEQRATAFENFFHAGSLEFAPEVLAHVREVCAAVPTVVDVFLDRPAILAPVVDAAMAVTANWGASAGALLDVLSGRFPVGGALPFDVPRSMAAVEASRPDVAFDTADPLFRFGHGLTLDAGGAPERT